ncbi:sulfatase domain protein [Hyphomonas neptunium ATCC 15444]|uniref:Sulfatase domain protein n=3 Tax=Hyphomonadaceae TaxID=69657 RepID=Q0C044_HYPNA|nr:sulfatase domain protein [Hyphomonas neptunium ATCC 15444]KCZ90518.1 sulfatase [Hyphomonas hirschiana VP5]
MSGQPLCQPRLAARPLRRGEQAITRPNAAVKQKSDLLEGGLRVPTIVRWPNRVPAGSTSDQVMITMDWYPTLLSVAGGAPDARFPSDGMDLTDQLLGGGAKERTLFWRHMHLDQEACRHGDYKYLKILDNTFLFNIVEDPRERANLKARLPDLFTLLQDKYQAWNASVLPVDPSAVSRVLPGFVLAEHFGVR